MQTKDDEIMDLIDAIGQHYRTNLGNRYVRHAFTVLPLDTRQWGLIESVTEKAEYHRYQGYHLDELYDRVLALAQFVYHARRELQPQLRARLSTYSTGPSPQGTDKVLRDMAVNNFASNLAILADLANKLYSRAVEIDVASARGGRPIYQTIVELEKLGTYLVPN